MSPFTFTVVEDQGQSTLEIWNSTQGEQITNGRFNPGIQTSRWWMKTMVKNESSTETRFFLLLNNPHINRLGLPARK